VVWGFEHEWIVDSFGEEWRLWLTTPEPEADGVPGPSRADLVGSDCPIAHLLYSGFDRSGAVNDAAAIVVLRIYGALRDEDVLGTLDDPDRPTVDPRALLSNYEERVASALYDAVQAGRLRFERAARSLPFADQPEKPAERPPPPAPAHEIEHFLELQVVTTRGVGVSGVACTITLPGAVRWTGVTGADGLLTLRDVATAGVATADLPRSRPFPLAQARSSNKGVLRFVDGGVPARVDARTVVEVPPSVVRARLIGMFFETDRAFLLPDALRGLRGLVRSLERYPGAQLLVVGHTDTTGTIDHNVKLSTARADAVSAFLRDDVDAWTPFFEASTPAEQRWGSREVQFMLSALPQGAPSKFFQAPFTGRNDKRTKDSVRRFQESRNAENGAALQPDGQAGPDTRRELVRAYMEVTGTSAPSESVIKTHGCGEFHPAEDLGDDVEDRENRRVEIFVFEDAIAPPPRACRAPGCAEHAKWLDQVTETIDFTTVPIDAPPLAAARPRSSWTPARSFPKPATVPTLREVCRRAAADHDIGILVIGNTDDFEADGAEVELSRARAQSVAAFLLGDASFFRARFDVADPVSRWDWPEVQWMLSAIEVSGDPCYAGLVDGTRGDETQEAIERFQLANKLRINRRLDEATLTALIEQYLKLLGPARPSREQVEIVAAGKSHAPRSFGVMSAELTGPELAEDTQADRRRVEIFLSPHVFVPAPTACVEGGGATCAAYEAWCREATEDISTPPEHDFLLRFTDAFTVPLAGASVTVAQHLPGEEPSTVGSFSASDFGVVRLNVPAGAYSLSLQVGDEEERAAFYVDPHEGGGLTIRTDRPSTVTE
jgi:outer membrane protein OmpA-like peptidoglycan-associated protein